MMSTGTKHSTNLLDTLPDFGGDETFVVLDGSGDELRLQPNKPEHQPLYAPLFTLSHHLLDHFEDIEGVGLVVGDMEN